MQKANQKHLTLSDRNYIEQALNAGMTFKDIGKFLSKDPTTISKEIKKHRIKKEPSYHTGYINICKYKYTCKRKNVCGKNCNGLYVLNIVQNAINFVMSLRKKYVIP